MRAFFNRFKTLVFLVLILLFAGLAWFTTDYDVGSSRQAPTCPIKVYGRCYEQKELSRLAQYFEVSRDLLLIDFALSLFGENRIDRDPTDFVINLIILRREAEKLGIEPTDEEARDAIRTSPLFGMQTWIDDEVLVARVLAPRGLTKADLFQLGKDYLCWRKLGDLLEAGNEPVPVEIDKTYVRNHQRFTAQMAEFSLADYKDKAAVSDPEIEEYYGKNKETLLSEEKRGVTLVRFTPPDQKDKTAEQIAEAKLAFNNRVNEIYAVLSDDETKFAELAKNFAADKTIPFGIAIEEIPPFNRQSVPESLKNENEALGDLFSGARSAAPGRSVTIPFAQESGGFIMFKIKEVIAPVPMTLDQAREQIKTALTAKKSNQLVNEAAAAARAKVQETLKAGKKPAEAAIAAGITLKPLPPFSQEEPPTGIDGAELLVGAARGTANGSVSDVLPIPPAKGYRFLILEKTELYQDENAESQKNTLAIRSSSDYRRALFQSWFQRRLKEAGVSRVGPVEPEMKDGGEDGKAAPNQPEAPEPPAES